MANILVIDDEELVRFSLQSMLEEEGHEVTVAENGAAGLAKLTANGFDIVISDIVMPEKEGIQTITEIRARHPDLKVIAISGGSRIGATDLLARASEVGANLILNKPFSTEVLFESIERLSKT